MDAVAIVSDEVRELIRREGLDPGRDSTGLRRLVEFAVAEYDERSLTRALPPLADPGQAIKRVLDEVSGFGALQPYLDDPSVEEIWINDPGRIFVSRAGLSELTTTVLTAQEVRDLVERMLKHSGRRVDLASPFVDAMLPDGSRLHVVIPDITRSAYAVNIRKFTVVSTRIDDLVTLGTLTPHAAEFLKRRWSPASTSWSRAVPRPGRRRCSTASSVQSHPASASSPVKRSSSCGWRCATAWPCSAARPVSRAPARCPCGGW